MRDAGPYSLTVISLESSASIYPCRLSGAKCPRPYTVSNLCQKLALRKFDRGPILCSANSSYIKAMGLRALSQEPWGLVTFRPASFSKYFGPTMKPEQTVALSGCNGSS